MTQIVEMLAIDLGVCWPPDHGTSERFSPPVWARMQHWRIRTNVGSAFTRTKERSHLPALAGRTTAIRAVASLFTFFMTDALLTQERSG